MKNWPPKAQMNSIVGTTYLRKNALPRDAATDALCMVFLLCMGAGLYRFGWLDGVERWALRFIYASASTARRKIGSRIFSLYSDRDILSRSARVAIGLLGFGACLLAEASVLRNPLEMLRGRDGGGGGGATGRFGGSSGGPPSSGHGTIFPAWKSWLNTMARLLRVRS